MVFSKMCFQGKGGGPGFLRLLIQYSSCNSNSCNSKNHLEWKCSLVPSEFPIKLSHQYSYNSNSHNSKTNLSRNVWWVPSAIFDQVIWISAKKVSITSFFTINLFGFILNQTHLIEKRNHVEIKCNARSSILL